MSVASDTHTDPDTSVEGARSSTDRYQSDDPGMETSSRPRLIEEHHVIGPHGEDELEATDERGRRWYQLHRDPISAMGPRLGLLTPNPKHPNVVPARRAHGELIWIEFRVGRPPLGRPNASTATTHLTTKANTG